MLRLVASLPQESAHLAAHLFAQKLLSQEREYPSMNAGTATAAVMGRPALRWSISSVLVIASPLEIVDCDHTHDCYSSYPSGNEREQITHAAVLASFFAARLSDGATTATMYSATAYAALSCSLMSCRIISSSVADVVSKSRHSGYFRMPILCA